MRCEAKRKRIRKSHRKSVRVLLTGKNRTGALVAAQKLVRDLREDLYHVDLEINYLLQRIEKYGGVAILAAGNRTKIDNALSQWFHFVIRVPPRRKSRRSALAM